jgi:hypothetical protein
MRIDQLEHILRAASAITNEREFVILGSQAILAACPEAKPPLDQSMELDIYPVNKPDAADLIDGTIGELSPFDQTFGYYAHGISPETVILPSGWRNRIITVQNENTNGATGLCISPLDLAISKLLAGRSKDLAFVRHMLDQQMIAIHDVLIVAEELEKDHQKLVESRLSRMAQNS